MKIKLSSATTIDILNNNNKTIVTHNLCTIETITVYNHKTNKTSKFKHYLN